MLETSTISWTLLSPTAATAPPPLPPSPPPFRRPDVFVRIDEVRSPDVTLLRQITYLEAAEWLLRVSNKPPDILCDPLEKKLCRSVSSLDKFVDIELSNVSAFDTLRILIDAT
nr:hypothetical protein HmN_000352300 [Hymenolepis microstoma]